MVPWSAFPGACFLDYLNAQVVSNGSGVIGQASAWLEITTQLAREFGHQIGYYL